MKWEPTNEFSAGNPHSSYDCIEYSITPRPQLCDNDSRSNWSYWIGNSSKPADWFCAPYPLGPNGNLSTNVQLTIHTHPILRFAYFITLSRGCIAIMVRAVEVIRLEHLLQQTGFQAPIRRVLWFLLPLAQGYFRFNRGLFLEKNRNLFTIET